MEPLVYRIAVNNAVHVNQLDFVKKIPLKMVICFDEPNTNFESEFEQRVGGSSTC